MSEGATLTKTDKQCGLCDQNLSKYCCPRCGVLYCSLDCYKSVKHQQCSESFYRDCVNEELTSNHTDDESKRKMIEILKKMNAESDGDELLETVDYDEVDSDDENDIDLHERIKDLNLNDADAIWNALTEDERNEFEALVQGDVGSIVPQWQPWWMYRREDKLIQDVSEERNEKEAKALKNCPELKLVPEFTSLTKVQPSPAIRFNITNIIASYAFISRYFNGELEPLEGTVYLLSICANLDSNTNFEDPEIAVESVVQKCLQSQLIQTDEASINIMKQDTIFIHQGPSKDNPFHYCKAALSHLHLLLTQANTAKNNKKINKNKHNVFSKKFPEHNGSHLPELDVSKVKKCVKKLEFYLSFLGSYCIE